MSTLLVAAAVNNALIQGIQYPDSFRINGLARFGQFKQVDHIILGGGGAATKSPHIHAQTADIGKAARLQVFF